MRISTTVQPRSGLSLLEVLASVAIFLLALGAISSLMNGATQRARDIQSQSQATLYCQSKLAEFVAGVESLDTPGSGDFEDGTDWLWSADSVADTTAPGLYKVTVRIYREVSPRFEMSISQYILSPTVRGNLSAASQQPPATDTTTTGGTTSSSSSGTTSSSGGSTSSSSSTPSSSSSGGNSSSGGTSSKGGGR